MKHLKIAVAVAALAGVASAVHAAPVTAKVSDKVVSSDQFPKLKASYPGGVVGWPDLVYGSINGYRPMTLDLYAPTKPGAPRPLVIYIHGGGWMNGTSRNAAAFSDFPAVMAGLAARGYVVASLNYRLGLEARFPAAAEDVDAAIRWLKAHAADYGIDKTRVAVWGGSAGGHLAALAATDCRPATATAESDCVQAAAIWYGVFDVAALPNGGPPYLNGQAAQASAVTFLDPSDPPFLLIHGDSDRTVPVAQSRAFAAKLKSLGMKGDYIELPGIDHSWIGKTPADTTAAHMKALQATFDFFDATVGKAGAR